MSPTQYYYWNKKLSLSQTSTYTPPVEWAALNIPTTVQPVSKESPVILHHKTYTLELREGFNQGVLSDVLKVIGALC